MDNEIIKRLDKNGVTIVLWDLLKETNLTGAAVTVEVDKAVASICNLSHNKDKIVEDIINKIVIVSHDIHYNGNHYKYVLDDINLEDIKQYLENVIS